MFLADFSGLTNVADFLLTWITSFDQLPAATRPRAIVIRENIIELFQQDVLSTQLLNELIQGQRDQSLYSSAGFSKIEVISLPRLSRPLLRNILSPAIEESIAQRQQARTLFTSTHFVTLFRHASEEMSTLEAPCPFNFVRASRIDNMVPAGFGGHI